MSVSSKFFEHIQTHERSWGDEAYPQRPSLAEMMSAAVVVFWKYGKEERWRCSVYAEMKELEDELSKMLFRASLAPTNRSIARIYGKQQRVCIEDVNIKFGYCDDN